MENYMVKLKQFVKFDSFDICTDAFQTLREVLTVNKEYTSVYLINNYDEFFENYNSLLLCDNYVLKRLSLKLLAEILLERKNFKVMIKYISYSDNLKLTMNLLKQSKNISVEAFHVFKVIYNFNWFQIFVANPKKTDEVSFILKRNKTKIVTFFDNFSHRKNRKHS